MSKNIFLTSRAYLNEISTTTCAGFEQRLLASCRNLFARLDLQAIHRGISTNMTHRISLLFILCLAMHLHVQLGLSKGM